MAQRVAGLRDADRRNDMALRVVTAIVLVAMLAAVLLLVYRWVAPKPTAVAAPFSMTITAPVNEAPPQPAAASAPPAQVLSSPDAYFQCVQKGRVSFSDKPCETGSEKVMPLPNARPAGAPTAAGKPAPPNSAPSPGAVAVPAALPAATPAPSATPAQAPAVPAATAVAPPAAPTTAPSR